MNVMSQRDMYSLFRLWQSLDFLCPPSRKAEKVIFFFFVLVVVDGWMLMNSGLNDQKLSYQVRKTNTASGDLLMA